MKTAKVKFEKSKMMRYIQDSHLYKTFYDMNKSLGFDKAMQKLFETEVLGHSGQEMRYMQAGIADRVAKRVMGMGKWTFECKSVDREGVLFQILYTNVVDFIRWTDLVKVIKEISPRAANNISALVKEGLPMNTANFIVREAEITQEGGKLVVFANVSAKWVPGTVGVDIQDVEESMMEAGLL
jgi:hypothetical protein